MVNGHGQAQWRAPPWRRFPCPVANGLCLLANGHHRDHDHRGHRYGPRAWGNLLLLTQGFTAKCYHIPINNLQVAPALRTGEGCPVYGALYGGPI